MAPPPRPRPLRVVLFIDGQNLYHGCREQFGWPWVHPLRLGQELVAADVHDLNDPSHVLTGVRYYTGIHDPNRRPEQHGQMARRLDAYRALGVHVEAVSLRYDAEGRAREKGVDARIALDLYRLGIKGLYDVAAIVSEDSDLDPAAADIYELRDDERWIALTNVLPRSPDRHTRWLPSVKRRRAISEELFERVRDDADY